MQAAATVGRTDGRPAPVAADAFRAAMRQFVTGVTIVTTWAADHPEGLTVNAFTAVSLTPPLVLVCIDRRSRTLPYILRAEVFAVNVLSSTQEELARRFADQSLTAQERFGDVPLVPEASLAPLLEGSLAMLECTITHLWPAGDHVVIVGEVVATRLGPGARSDAEPLMFFAGELQPAATPAAACPPQPVPRAAGERLLSAGGRTRTGGGG